jgi:hypothetical protein
LTRTTTCNSLLGALLSNVLDLRSNLKLGGDLDYELTREGGGGSPEEAAGSPRWEEVVAVSQSRGPATTSTSSSALLLRLVLAFASSRVGCGAPPAPLL